MSLIWLHGVDYLRLGKGVTPKTAGIFLVHVCDAEIWPLCNQHQIESQKDTVLDDVEMNSFIALPGKGAAAG